MDAWVPKRRNKPQMTIQGLRPRRLWLATATIAVAAMTATSCSSSSPTTKSSSSSQATSQPNTPPADVQSELNQVAVQQSDVPSGYLVQLFNGGDQVTDQVTLDLCNAIYPSENLRVARYQVGVAQNSQSMLLLSTEAVAYRDASATAQAFSELSNAAAHCPSGYVPSQLAGDPPVRTVFGPKPDAGWPKVGGVERLAFDATVNDQQGQSQETVGVYLRRGEFLRAVYIDSPKSPVAIDGQTSLQGIANIFAQRLASLPTAGVA